MQQKTPKGAVLRQAVTLRKAVFRQVRKQGQTACRGSSFQLENERLSVIGVSVDEELTNLIQYQQGFLASARIISTVNTMLDVIVNLGR